jgi:tRNA pseudouridine13 synthase
LRVPRIDKLLGINVYATETAGIGGAIRRSVEDFAVEEVLVDGSKAKIDNSAEKRVLGASSRRQRYLLCVLVKRNWDTFIAIKNVAKQLGISQTQVHIAGIKDAKAVTAQHITIENGSMEDTLKVNVKDIEIRPVGYVREALSSFYLLGNSFSIRIKAINHSESTIEKRIAETNKELAGIGGIPNFFGHQRFGTTRPITHLVGKAMVKGDFEEAATLFLAQPSDYEHPSSRQARMELQSTQNFEQALQNFPRQLRYERMMLSHLVEKPTDFVGAFKQLPIKLQALFVQAIQSYLFNRFLSERIRRGFSLNRAEVGDYVLSVERSGLPMVNVAKTVDAETIAEADELIKTGRRRIGLPLVGNKQRLSQGVMGQIEKQILEEEGIKPENFGNSAILKNVGRGGLRAVITPIKDFTLHGISASTNNPKERQADLSFRLLRGSYATVLLREIMKPHDPISAGF